MSSLHLCSMQNKGPGSLEGKVRSRFSGLQSGAAGSEQPVSTGKVCRQRHTARQSLCFGTAAR